MKKTFISWLLIGLVTLAGCASPKSIFVQVPEPDYWPTTDWKSSTSPEAQGMDSGLLAQMLEDISANKTGIHSVLVIRNGYMVTEAYFHPYTRDTKMQIQSVTKSVIGALVGIAVKEGNIKSANEKLISFFPDRTSANPSQNKDSIRLKHLLSMSSGFPCQEFINSGQSMEQASSWVQFMLDLPVDTPPGKTFSYCDGNPHLLSAIIKNTTGMNAREFANQKLFKPLGIPAVETPYWPADAEGFSYGGYGLYLRPVDLAKLALLYLQDGKWEGKQILPAGWVADSTRQYVQKPEGPGYGYLWTVYPESGRYSALGMAGQQIHVYPSKNLIVVVTAELETYMEAPEIERLLNKFILPAIQSDASLAENPGNLARLKAAEEVAANPIQPVPALPPIASEISGKLYTLEENPVGWQTIVVFFEPGANVAQVTTNGSENLDDIGLDNLYRRATLLTDQYMMRGRWVDHQTFAVEWTPLPLGNNGTSDIRLNYSGDNLEIKIQSLIFDGEPTVIQGSK
jgi:CubicO group peptidase (beta-lactamase class C family)